MKTFSTEKARHVLLIARAGEPFPDALTGALRAEAVSTGWLRASGVLRDVELRAHAPDLGGLATARRFAGPLHVLSLEGSVGLASGEVSFGTHAVMARETDRGLEVLAGEIVSGTIVALEAHVVALDDLALPRALERDAGVWLLDANGQGVERAVTSSFEEAPTFVGRDPAEPSVAEISNVPNAWGEVIAASDQQARARSLPTQRSPGRAATLQSRIDVAQVTGATAGPVPPSRGRRGDDDAPFPEAGDQVQHFAFGRADVLKSDGERLHLKVHKDGRIREIALEMLRVTPMGAAENGKRAFKLDRKV